MSTFLKRRRLFNGAFSTSQFERRFMCIPSKRAFTSSPVSVWWHRPWREYRVMRGTTFFNFFLYLHWQEVDKFTILLIWGPTHLSIVRTSSLPCWTPIFARHSWNAAGNPKGFHLNISIFKYFTRIFQQWGVVHCTYYVITFGGPQRPPPPYVIL